MYNYMFYSRQCCTFQRVLTHEEDSALLKAYIAEWGKFFTQCDYLPKPFGQLETALAGKAHSTMQKKTQGEESIVRKVEEISMLCLCNKSQVIYTPSRVARLRIQRVSVLSKLLPPHQKLKDCTRNTTACVIRERFSPRQIQSETKFSRRQNSV